MDDEGRCNCRNQFVLVEERLGESLETMVLREQGVRGFCFPTSVHRGGLTVDDWLWYCTSMLDAVAGLHKRCIVHGDIKPANFCLAPHGEGEQIVKIIDFGTQLFLQ